MYPKETFARVNVIIVRRILRADASQKPIAQDAAETGKLVPEPPRLLGLDAGEAQGRRNGPDYGQGER